MTDIIEGSAVEIVPAEIRTVSVVQQPGQSLVARSNDPSEMVAVASRLATVLADIVERQNLYADIRGKKFPKVEAWMTIGRLDNVVARESASPIRHDDGSYEAFAEIIRLSDGMVIGSSSALCGTKDDAPWPSRSEPARRAMAQTRAISRAFRGQYSWIMALAGYEPTPAEEMPHDSPDVAPRSAPPAGGTTLEAAVVEGRVVAAGNGLDLSLRMTPEGGAFGFKLLDVEGHPHGRKTSGVRMLGSGAEALAAHSKELDGALVKVIGRLHPESFDDKETGRTVRYHVIHADSVATEAFAVMDTDPAPVAPSGSEKVNDLDNLPW